MRRHLHKSTNYTYCCIINKNSRSIPLLHIICRLPLCPIAPSARVWNYRREFTLFITRPRMDGILYILSRYPSSLTIPTHQTCCRNHIFQLSFNCLRRVGGWRRRMNWYFPTPVYSDSMCMYVPHVQLKLILLKVARMMKMMSRLVGTRIY